MKIPEGWVPLSEVIDFIEKNKMRNNPNFVLDNWEYKYIEVRVDMRNGMAIISPGNKREQTITDELKSTISGF